MELIKRNPYIMGVCLFVFAISCQKNSSPSPNPCDTPVDIPDFQMFERVADTLFQTDAALTSNSVVFKAPEKYDSVKWKVGTDDRVFTERKFNLIFDDPQIVAVTLIGHINKRFQCGGKKADTVTKQLEIKEPRASYTTGKFRGYRLSNPSDIFTLEIKQVNDPSWYSDYFIYNFPKECTVWEPPFPKDAGYMISAGARHFRIRNDLPAIQACLYEVFGVGKVLSNDSLYIEFNYRQLANDPKKVADKFIGKRQ